MKLVLDFKNKDALNIINNINNLKNKKNIELDILAFDINNNNSIDRAYYALYYSKNYGVEYEFSKRILEAYHLEDKDISRVDVLATCYQDIGYDKNDMIDSLMDGDYNDMYTHIQRSYLKEYQIKESCTLIKDNKDTILGCNEVTKYLESI